MNIADVKYTHIANGPGVRTSIYVSGCTHKCPGCFNEETHDFNYGRLCDYTYKKEIADKIKSLEGIRGISILGGEPLQQDPDDLYDLLWFLKDYTDLPIWLWTGYSYKSERDVFVKYKDALELCDIIIDGRYNEDLKDYRLKYRGSSNQNVLEVNSLDLN